jgi:ATP synthase H subunit
LLVIILGMADVLRKIKQAEQDAEKQLADAQAEVGKIAAEARRQSVQLVADATDGSVSDTQATLDAARAKANKEAEGVAKEGQKVVDAIESSAADRKDKAVAHLLEKVNSQ